MPTKIRKSIVTQTLDKESLPKDRQIILWQNDSDIEAGRWKKGYYLADSERFCQGTQDCISRYDWAFNVVQWKAL